MAAKLDMRMVYAVPGRRVRDPAHPQRGAIPDTGRNVQWGTYWELALKAGDIALEPPGAEPPADAAKPGKAQPATAGAPPPPPAASASDVKG